MSFNYQINLLSLKNLPDIMAIERSVFEYPWSASMMRDSLLSVNQKVCGLFSEKGDLMGYGILSVVIDEAELLDMTVKKDIQRKGYGKIMLDFLCSTAKNEGANEIFLEVREDNVRATDVYLKSGFEQIDRRKNYYKLDDKNQVDALVMKRVL